MPVGRSGQALLNALMVIWRDLTAPAWLPAWECLCAETGAELVSPAPWRVGRVRAKHRSFTIDVSSWNTEYSGTALRTELRNSTGLTFAVQERGALDGLRGVFENSPFKTGDPEFDESFRIVGSPTDDLEQLL